jgi:hypothetical protein
MPGAWMADSGGYSAAFVGVMGLMFYETNDLFMNVGHTTIYCLALLEGVLIY